MAKIRAHELRSKTKTELQSQLKELKEELAALRVSQHTNGASAKLVKIGAVRKSVARVLTVYNQSTKDSLRKQYSGSKVLPIALREKKTRAIRRRLTKAQASAKTLKQKKKEGYYPKRVYAVKAV